MLVRMDQAITHLARALVAVGLLVQTAACGVAPRLGGTPDVASAEAVLGRRIEVATGQIRTLDHPDFEHAAAGDAVWSPLAMLEKGAAGIYFLEPYDPKRVPVLFVPGIGGTPRDFERTIESLDRSRFQAWVFFYPGGLRLHSTARLLGDVLTALQRQHRFETLFITAHSLGGLVSLGYLKSALGNGDYVKLIVTLSSPFEGHPWAAVGTQLMPAPVPSWSDLSPGSEFLAALRAPGPHGGRRVPHYVFFSFQRNVSMLIPQSSDGIVPVSSQLPVWIQDQAERYWGYDATHVGILSHGPVLERYNALLKSEADRLRADPPLASCR
jgi:hypothetical protein